MQSNVAISVKSMSKYYEFSHGHEWSILGRRKARTPSGSGYQALSNINLEIMRGEAVGIVGKNGAGKSTLLQILTGSLQPTTGQVLVKGRVSALLELGAGFNPELTGRENIFLSGAVLGMSKSEVNTKSKAIIAFADIGEFIDRPVKSYSSGMMVRLGFALQVHIDPDILIIDEALSVGDIFFQQKCINKIREILSRGVTLLFVSHGLNSVKSLCSRAIHLEKGVIKADGPADSVCDSYQNAMTSSSSEDWRLAVETSKMAGDVGDNLSIGKFYGLTGPIMDAGFSARLSQRSGSGELCFTGMIILDDNGKPAQAIEQAGTVTIRSFLQAHRDIPEGAAIGVLIRVAAGVDLLALNSDFYRYRVPALQAGRHYIWDVKVYLPLARGYYSLHCGVKPASSGGYFYDRCFNATLLEVISNPVDWGDYGGRIIMKPNMVTLAQVIEEK